MKYLTIKFPNTMSLGHLSLEDRVEVVSGGYHSQGKIVSKIEDVPDGPACTEANPCCDRQNDYNGFGSDGPLKFVCLKHCPCHD